MPKVPLQVKTKASESSKVANPIPTKKKGPPQTPTFKASRVEKKSVAPSVKEGSPAAVRQEQEHVIYVGHLPMNFTEGPLKRFLSQFGTVENLVLSRSHKTGRMRGYGFAQFADSETAEKAAKEVHGTFLEGRSLVAHTIEPTKVHRNMFVRRDQRLRILVDRKRRLEGYTPKPKRSVRTSMDALQQALMANIKVEKSLNERLKALGIPYSFNGFQLQEKVLQSRA